ncbi:hypothetical protein A3L04_00295 [Thermococcus chitonophagus]|uniref:Uncharacterized protein n=1 Tax=Thermococcus chitonophagus TaxID=54262 RepID=A0A160VTE3_9EURY|nr:hypothetical protein [Thermococcus chitonophagus]ASJ15623.1 hypothetical protein A3L04_00295 [Thermococcus chitonophagus]CUX76831.1 hypothetical protein CHITON_0052 [Thermococcus chitonophagus]
MALIALSIKYEKKMVIVFVVLLLISVHFLYPYWKARSEYREGKELINNLVSLGGKGNVHRTCNALPADIAITKENYRALISVINSSLVNFTISGGPPGPVVVEGIINNDEDISKLKDLNVGFEFDRLGCEEINYTKEIKLLEEHLSEVPGCCRYYYERDLNSLKSLQAKKEACERLCENYTYVRLFVSPKVYYWPEMWRDTAKDSFILGAVVLSLTLLIKRKL